MNQQDILALNELKMLSLDMISRAGSGSPGVTLSMAPIVYTLFHRHFNFRPNDLSWINRDRLVVSTGHASSLVYAAMHMAGYPIKKEDLMAYRSIHSITPGFLEYGTTPGVDASTGLFGSGIACATGMALTERYLRGLIKNEEDRLNIIDYNIYCLCSDGDLMEGVSNEAMSFAGAQNLDKLILLYDANSLTEDGPLNNVLEEDFMRKYQAMGFFVDMLKDSTNIREIDKSINSAKRSGKPSLIIFKTVLGKDSFNENKNIVHSKPLSVDDVANLRKKWNLFLPPFEVSKDSIIYISQKIQERMEKKYNKWLELFNRAKNSGNTRLLEIIKMLEEKQITIPFDSNSYKINDNYRESLRESNLKVLNLIGNKTNLFLGGSADLSIACQTYLNNTSDMTLKNPTGRNIRFGSRENAMASILNGMALSGLRVFGSTKLVYADYLKPAIRMTSLMNLPVTYIFTHDTIGVGEDGPVAQPIEQLASLRSTPNLIVYRPADITELMGVWENILAKNLPSALIITQNSVPKLPGSDSKLIQNGAYILKREQSKLDGILISSGSELVYALQIAYDLAKIGIDIRVVSMPSMELFLSSGLDYEETILPKNVKKIVIEASSSLLWNRFATNENYIIGINEFGYSGHPNEVLKELGFDYDSLKMKVEELLK